MGVFQCGVNVCGRSGEERCLFCVCAVGELFCFVVFCLTVGLCGWEEEMKEKEEERGRGVCVVWVVFCLVVGWCVVCGVWWRRSA